MAKKTRTVYVCQECGYESPRYLGRCVCGAWNSMVEKEVEVTPSGRSGEARLAVGESASPERLNKVTSADYDRITSGIGELDRVLGGGFVRGSIVLISGEPGIGKSTLITQAASNISASGEKVLYVSGEESEEQIKMRADRICGKTGISDDLFVMAETNIENIFRQCEAMEPSFLIIDSVQTMFTDTLDSAPGSVSQVRACGNMLMKMGKQHNITVFIVAHVTKSGDLAGPKTVEHLVDCVLSFTGERNHEIRILRAFKNRFGTTSEIGAFSMEREGLREITNLSDSLIENREEAAEGAVITAAYEGSRPVFLEVQALVSPANVGFARRTAVGFDYQRLSMMLAVMEKKLGIRMSDQDVYVNIAGGLKPDSTSVDLGAVLAVYSSVRSITPKAGLMAVGEVGLTGEIRSVMNAGKIALEASRLGYTRIIMPYDNARKISGEKFGGLEVIGVKNIYEAVTAFKN
ncbi:MAG: DNA repair protein RadA [Anaerovoracaceae bacterium]